MSQNPQEVIQNFLAPSGYASLTDVQRRAYILENLNVERLAKSIRSIAKKENGFVQTLNKNEIKDYNFTSSMLGWASNPYQEAPKQSWAGEGSNPFSHGGTSYDIDITPDNFEAKPFSTKRLKDFFGGLSGFFNKKGRPGAAASSNEGSLSISFLLMVLIILWAGFAVTQTANGTKTTRIKILGAVISGRGYVA